MEPGSPTLTPSTGWARLIGAVLRRPRLWPTALVEAYRFRRRRWWRRRPFLPVPDPPLLRFRMMTAYGGDGRGVPRPADLVAWLEWCRRQARLDRGGTDIAAD